ncbi:MAG: hypothetical protein V2I33_16360 [Kangiellaceae bacterium]|jgi:hypothetical protein|nr:hypothetical protein [Kangiellaceae bacterium]
MKCPECGSTTNFLYEMLSFDIEIEGRPHVEDIPPINGNGTCRTCNYKGLTKEFDDGLMPKGFGLCAIGQPIESAIESMKQKVNEL